MLVAVAMIAVAVGGVATLIALRLQSGTKLEAARQYRYDLKLSEFNNQPPEVSSIEAMVKSMAK